MSAKWTWIKGTLSKLVQLNTLEERDTIHRDLNRLERRVCAKLTKFNNALLQVQHLALGHPKHKSRLEDEQMESSPAENDLE